MTSNLWFIYWCSLCRQRQEWPTSNLVQWYNSTTFFRDTPLYELTIENWQLRSEKWKILCGSVALRLKMGTDLYEIDTEAQSFFMTTKCMVETDVIRLFFPCSDKHFTSPRSIWKWIVRQAHQAMQVLIVNCHMLIDLISPTSQERLTSWLWPWRERLYAIRYLVWSDYVRVPPCWVTIQ